MSGPTTTNRLLAIPAAGTNVDTWGDDASYSLNANAVIIDALFGAGNVTLTTSQAQNAVINLTGIVNAATRTLTFPAINAYYLIFNDCTCAAGTDRVVLLSTGAGDVICVPNGAKMLIHTRSGSGGVAFADQSQWAPGDYKEVGWSVTNAMPAWVTNCTVAPWLLCNGQAVSRTTYAQLFARISTSFGAGNGTTTFNVPDRRFRVGVPPDNMGGSAANRDSGAEFDSGDADTVGSTGGEASHTLTEAELASHDHTVDDPGHEHVMRAITTAATSSEPGNRIMARAGTDIYAAATPNVDMRSGSVKENTTGITLEDAGSDDAHNNMQPFLISGQVWIKT
jgi:microcystin-dependent protein